MNIEGFVRIAVATPKVKVCDIEHNTEAVRLGIEEAERHAASLIVFPELVLTAYTCADLFHQTLLIEKTRAALDVLREATKGLSVVAVVGAPVMVQQKLYNCAVILQNGRILAIIPKRNLPNYSEFYEARWFTPGSYAVQMLPWRMPDGSIEEIPFGMNILLEADNDPYFVLAAELCEDVWVADPPSTRHAIAGATIIANCSASDEMIGKGRLPPSVDRGHECTSMCLLCLCQCG